MLPLIGSLQHVSKVVKPGCAIVHRAIELSTHRHMEAYIRLNCKYRSNIEWWFQMATAWNGVSILAPLSADSSDGAITSDASGGWGCGAFHEPVPNSMGLACGPTLHHSERTSTNCYLGQEVVGFYYSSFLILLVTPFTQGMAPQQSSLDPSPVSFNLSNNLPSHAYPQSPIQAQSQPAYPASIPSTHTTIFPYTTAKLTTSYFYPESLKPTILSNISTIKHSPSLPTVPSLQTYLSQPQTPPFAPPAATSPCVPQYLKIKLPRNIIDSSIINKQSLTDQDQIISTYHKYQTVQKVPSLAQKLAFKSYFRANVLRQCTVMGVTEYLALPTDTLTIWSNNFLPLLSSGRTKNSLSLGGHLVQRLMANYANN